MRPVNVRLVKVKAGFHMIATLATIATIAGKNVQQSLRSYANRSSAIVAITAIVAMVNIPECTASYTYSKLSADFVEKL